MSPPSPTLHMICGKIAAGKSTLAGRIARSEGAVLLAEDDWLAALYPDEIVTASDYMRRAAKLRGMVGPHVVSLLNAGVSVVLDFQANTVESRRWMRGILDKTDASHRLHVLMPPDAVCLERLHERNRQGDHPFAVTEAQFREISKYFVAPIPDEGFDTILHDRKT